MIDAERMRRGHDDAWESASSEKKNAMMQMLLELRAGMERKLLRYILPSAERLEIVEGAADVEAMILQAGGDPAGLTH